MSLCRISVCLFVPTHLFRICLQLHCSVSYRNCLLLLLLLLLLLILIIRVIRDRAVSLPGAVLTLGGWVIWAAACPNNPVFLRLRLRVAFITPSCQHWYISVKNNKISHKSKHLCFEPNGWIALAIVIKHISLHSLFEWQFTLCKQTSMTQTPGILFMEWF